MQESPEFFANYFLPLTKKLVAARKKDESELRGKKYSLLIEQIWGLFPCYCESARNLDLALPKIMPTIKLKLGQDNQTIIHAIAVGFTKIVDALQADTAISPYDFLRAKPVIGRRRTHA